MSEHKARTVDADEHERVLADRDMYLDSYIKTMRRHHDTARGAILLAAKGEWGGMLNHLGDSLNNVDAVDPEDVEVFEQAKVQVAEVTRLTEQRDTAVGALALVSHSEDSVDVWRIVFDLLDEPWAREVLKENTDA